MLSVSVLAFCAEKTSCRDVNVESSIYARLLVCGQAMSVLYSRAEAVNAAIANRVKRYISLPDHRVLRTVTCSMLSTCPVG